MIFKILINLILIILITIFELSFVKNLPTFFGQFNLIIVVIVFSLEFFPTRKIVWYFLLVGFLFDIYLSFFFGFFIIFWPIVFLFSKFISSNFFTNKSLYSFFGITFFTTVFYYIFLYLSFYMWKYFSGEAISFFLFSKEFYLNMFSSVGLNLLVIFILFYFINFLSNKLKPVFLFKNAKS